MPPLSNQVQYCQHYSWLAKETISAPLIWYPNSLIYILWPSGCDNFPPPTLSLLITRYAAVSFSHPADLLLLRGWRHYLQPWDCSHFVEDYLSMHSKIVSFQIFFTGILEEKSQEKGIFLALSEDKAELRIQKLSADLHITSRMLQPFSRCKMKECPPDKHVASITLLIWWTLPTLPR